MSPDERREARAERLVELAFEIQEGDVACRSGSGDEQFALAKEMADKFLELVIDGGGSDVSSQISTTTLMRVVRATRKG